MTDVYNYCTKCGTELKTQEQTMAESLPAAPLCLSCRTDGLAETIDSIGESVADRLSGFAEDFTEDFSDLYINTSAEYDDVDSVSIPVNEGDDDE